MSSMQNTEAHVKNTRTELYVSNTRIWNTCPEHKRLKHMSSIQITETHVNNAKDWNVC